MTGSVAVASQPVAVAGRGAGVSGDRSRSTAERRDRVEPVDRDGRVRIGRRCRDVGRRRRRSRRVPATASPSAASSCDESAQLMSAQDMSVQDIELQDMSAQDMLAQD